jgi:hypothetical protein
MRGAVRLEVAPSEPNVELTAKFPLTATLVDAAGAGFEMTITSVVDKVQ